MDYYAVLGVASTVSNEELRARFHALVLKLHPDKLRCGEKQDDNSRDDEQMLHDVYAAWEVLGSPKSRADYDRQLKARQIQSVGPVHESVDLDEMEYDEERRAFIRPCRCGGDYIAFEDDLEHELAIFNCSTCSLKIRLLYQVAAA